MSQDLVWDDGREMTQHLPYMFIAPAWRRRCLLLWIGQFRHMCLCTNQRSIIKFPSAWEKIQDKKQRSHPFRQYLRIWAKRKTWTLFTLLNCPLLGQTQFPDTPTLTLPWLMPRVQMNKSGRGGVGWAHHPVVWMRRPIFKTNRAHGSLCDDWP